MNVLLNHYMGHELPIDVINLANKPLELKLEGGGDNRSLAILSDLPVCVQTFYSDCIFI